jgi:hypothetical protein
MRTARPWMPPYPESCTQCGRYLLGGRHLHEFVPFRWIRSLRLCLNGTNNWPWQRET